MADHPKSGSAGRYDEVRTRHPQLGLTLAGIFLAQLALFLAVVFLYSGVSMAAISQFSAYGVGSDYPFYYRAAQKWIAGGNPYTEINALPLSILSGALFLKLPMKQAFHAYQLLNIVALSGTTLWFASRNGLSRSNTACLLFITLAFAPTYSILVGGNVDAMMLAILLAACCAENRWARAFLLTASIWTKLYSALAAAELAIARRWRLVVPIAIMLVLVGAPFLSLLTALPASLHTRVGWFKPTGNISPAVIFELLIGRQHPLLWRSAYFIFWAGTLFALSLKQRNRADSEIIASCTPWMIAMPSLVGFYSGVLLLPVAAQLMRVDQERRLMFWERVSVLGFLLVGIYPLAFVYVLPITQEQYDLYRGIFMPMGALGMTLVLAGIAGQSLSRTTPQTESGRVAQPNEPSEPNNSPTGLGAPS